MDNKIMAMALIIVSLASALETNSTNYGVRTLVVSDGGTNVSSAGYESGVVAGTVTGSALSSTFETLLGFFFSLDSGLSITAVYPKSSEDPVSCANRTVGAVLFNVTDAHGRDDINLSATYVNFTKGSAVRQSATCVDAGGSGNDMTVSCTGAEFNYWDAPGEWLITAHVEDSNGGSSTDDSSNMSYTNGIFLRINNDPITFGAVMKASADNLNTNSPAVDIENCGNVRLNVSVTGSNITDGGSNSMWAGNFKLSDQNATGSPLQITLSESPQGFQPSGGLNVSNGTPSAWGIYSFVTIPSDQPAADYNTGTWTFTPSQAS
jgi:hypothetical protein